MRLWNLIINILFIHLDFETIKAFQEAYKKDFGEEITEEEAEKIGNNLTNLFQVIYKPIPKEL